MKVLVTGASGFLGRAVTTQLELLGYDVYGLGLSAHDDFGEHSSSKFIAVDLFSETDVNLFMKKHQFEGLVHLAWDTQHGNYWQSNENFKWVAASLRLFEEFRINCGKRIVVAGSSAEYQWGEEPVLDEYTTPRSPASLYGVSKNSLRLMLQSWALQNDLSWAWGSVFNIFGPFENRNRLIPKNILKLLNRETILFDDGLLYRDFLHVKDAGAAFSALFKSDVQGVVNIASGQSISVRDVLQTIADLVNASGLIHFDESRNYNNLPKSVIASVNRLEKEVGWSTEISLFDRLASTCRWWRTTTEERM